VDEARIPGPALLPDDQVEGGGGSAVTAAGIEENEVKIGHGDR